MMDGWGWAPRPLPAGQVGSSGARRIGVGRPGPVVGLAEPCSVCSLRRRSARAASTRSTCQGQRDQHPGAVGGSGRRRTRPASASRSTGPVIVPQVTSRRPEQRPGRTDTAPCSADRADSTSSSQVSRPAGEGDPPGRVEAPGERGHARATWSGRRPGRAAASGAGRHQTASPRREPADRGRPVAGPRRPGGLAGLPAGPGRGGGLAAVPAGPAAAAGGLAVGVAGCGCVVTRAAHRRGSIIPRHQRA